jgi:hypothetical protein
MIMVVCVAGDGELVGAGGDLAERINLGPAA